jgi:DNA-directed RNA polymerase beta' subunit
MALPGDLEMETFVRGGARAAPPARALSTSEDFICVREGKLMCGSPGKEMLGAVSGGFVHTICKEHGGGRARDFITFAQWISSEWLCERGYSVGMFDAVMPERVQRDIGTVLRADLARISDMAERARALHAAGNGSIMHQQISQAISSCVELASMKAHRATKEFVDAMGVQNPLNATIISGSKGTDANMFQIMTCLGQQYFEGAPIGRMAGIERPLPCFEPGDCRASVRGMIIRDFGHGISPSEYFLHAVSSREGLVNTSIKTSTTGYTQRRLIKGMEDLRTIDDGSVRGAHGKITQFLFGGDGRDPARLVRAPVFLRELCAADTADLAAQFASRARADYVLGRLRRQVAESHVAEWSVRAMDETVQMPIDCARVWRSRGAPRRYAFSLERSRARLDARGSEQALIASFSRLLDDPLFEWCALLVSRAAAGPALVDWLAYVLHESEYSRVPAGEMVGIRCAQSVCEPTTQMTLNTFHRSGAKHAITEGVPRFNEIISASGETKTPYMLIPLLPSAKQQQTPQEIARKVRRVMLSRVTRSSFVIHDPPCAAPERTCVHKDRVLLQQLAACNGGMSEADVAAQFFAAPVSEYLIRIELEPELMREMDLAPDAFVKSVESLCDCPTMFVVSDDTAKRWVMRIRLVGMLTQEAAKAAHASITRAAFANGLRGIRHAQAVKKTVFGRSGPPQERDFIETSGSSLISVSTQPWADFLHTYSNDVQEVAAELGIEAANRVIYEELNKIIRTEYPAIDPRHLQMLADAITRSGAVTPMTRHGINRRDTPISTRISFEELMESLCNGAIVGERDILETPSGSIMVGERTFCGTGAFAVDFSSLSKRKRTGAAPAAQDFLRQRHARMASMAAPEDIERSKMRAIEAHRTRFKAGPEHSRYAEAPRHALPPAELFKMLTEKLQSEQAMATSVRMQDVYDQPCTTAEAIDECT